jgi:hypothetical protein
MPSAQEIEYFQNPTFPIKAKGLDEQNSNKSEHVCDSSSWKSQAWRVISKREKTIRDPIIHFSLG